MRQFEAYPNPSPRSAQRIPFLIALQSHLLAASHTTVVAPMLRNDGASAFTEVNVEVTFKGEDYIVLVSELAAVETKSLRNAQGDLSGYEEISAGPSTASSPASEPPYSAA